MTAATLTVGILALAGAAVLGYLYWDAVRERRPGEDVPPAMRPGYSDDELEKRVLERWMGWGVIFTLFFALFFPIYWIYETGRLADATEERFVAQVEEGRELFQENCAQCHGGDLGGGAADSPYEGDEAWPAPRLDNIVARYDENEHVDDIERFLYNTIYEGRPGTPMPAFGEDAAGAFTDQQIEEVRAFILWNQVDELEDEPDDGEEDGEELSGEELFQDNCMRCHGPDLEGWDNTEEQRNAPPLVGVFERHTSAGILGILQNGIFRPNSPNMPPWGADSYQHTPYTDEALVRIINYLRDEQPDDELPDDEADEKTLADIEEMKEEGEDDDGGDGGDDAGGDATDA